MKIIKSILCFIIGVIIIVIFVTGCSINEGINNSNSKISAINSKVEYISFRNKKIYLTESVEDFILQFKGLKCKISGPDSNITSSFEIDNINDKNHAFYTMHGGGQKLKIECPKDGNISSAEFDIKLKFDFNTEEYYVNKKIIEWSICSLQEKLDIYMDGKKIIFGDENKNVEQIDTLISKLGSDYEVEEDYYGRTDYIVYNDDMYSYSFSVMNSSITKQGTKIYGLYVKENS